LSIIILSAAIGIFSWFGIRKQLFVGDNEFVKGMILHHAAAVLMSEKANLTDPELIQLQKRHTQNPSRRNRIYEAKA
jgi:hypothetical protein